MGSGTDLKMNPPLLKGTKTNTYQYKYQILADKEGFEPPVLISTPAFKADTFDHSAIYPLMCVFHPTKIQNPLTGDVTPYGLYNIALYARISPYNDIEIHYISDFILNYYRLWGNRTRTYAWLHQKQLPYRLGYTPIINYLLLKESFSSGSCAY